MLGCSFSLFLKSFSILTHLSDFQLESPFYMDVNIWSIFLTVPLEWLKPPRLPLFAFPNERTHYRETSAENVSLFSKCRAVWGSGSCWKAAASSWTVAWELKGEDNTFNSIPNDLENTEWKWKGKPYKTFYCFVMGFASRRIVPESPASITSLQNKETFLSESSKHRRDPKFSTDAQHLQINQHFTFFASYSY